MNEVVKENINLWDLKKINGDLYAKTLILDYKSLHKKTRKSNSKIRIRKKYGWPIFIFKYKKRMGLIVGSLIFASIMYISSLYIWSINIIGNERITTPQILTVMKEFGIDVGSKKSNIDSRLLKQVVMSKLSDISWISINIEGSCLNVSVKERVQSPDIISEGSSCNIVAKSEGQIERLEVYKGTPCVKEGDAVLEGQILITGVKENENGNTSFSEASGKVFAITKHNIKESINLNQLNSIDTGKIVKKYKLKFCEKIIPLNPWKKIDDDYRVEKISKKIRFIGIEIPIFIDTDICYQQKCEEKFLSLEEANIILEKIIEEREKNELSNFKIISKNIESYEQENNYIFDVNYSCVKDIAEKKDISFE